VTGKRLLPECVPGGSEHAYSHFHLRFVVQNPQIMEFLSQRAEFRVGVFILIGIMSVNGTRSQSMKMVGVLPCLYF
jgi:hypothetical protein